MIQRIKGTQDLLDLSLFSYVIETTKRHLETFHFTEIETPIIEPTELFKRSLGLATDVVGKEMYYVTAQESNEQICLRPEATASMMRAFLNNTVQQEPWRVFTWGPMFRHERPQKGRLRQFHQVSLEVIGTPTVLDDVWMITLLDRLFQEHFQLDEYALLINFLGCAADRQEHKKRLLDFLDQHKTELCENCHARIHANTLRIFDCKNDACQTVYKNAPTVLETLCTSCMQEWETVQKMLKLLSVSFSIKATLVRGLDYYTKTVFEFVSAQLGAQNTFCGGGRYDGLAELLGSSKPVPSVGAAFGIERMAMMLQNKSVPLAQPKRLHAVVPFSTEQVGTALLVADELISHGLVTELIFEGDSIKSKLRKVNKTGALYAILIGKNEQDGRYVTLKNMTTGEEQKIPQTELIQQLKQ